MSTEVKDFSELLIDSDAVVDSAWRLKVVKSDQCLSYVAWNEKSKEALVVDPKEDDYPAYQKLIEELKGYRWLAVVDTHTHADHISVAAKLADELEAPLIMHEKSISHRVHCKLGRDTRFNTASGPLGLIHTPGHTPCGLTVFWGPYIFTGDTILFGDTGRDDLPGGDAVQHYDSLQKVLKVARSEMIMCPGHDHKGGRLSTWATQLKANPSLTQPRDQFIAEASAFDAPAPELLKKSLKENFK